MSKKMLIDATHAEETRVVVVDGNKVEEFDFETLNKRQLAGNIYLAKVTRVEPSLQAAFVDYGGNRHGFLAFSEIHPDYYQIPVADRKAILEEERALDRDEEDEDERRRRRPNRNRRGAKPAAAEAAAAPAAIEALEVIDLAAEAAGAEAEDAPRAEGDEPYRAMDHAADLDEEIESVAEEDIADEIAEPRRPRLRRYKIQEVVKVRQIMLVQVVKEERGTKGAALTTYLSLAGRYCVLMPNTARGGGISRKITQPADRKKLKEIAGELDVPEGAGLIIRTAGAKRTKAEIKRDYEYLMRLWEQVRDLTLRSIAPAPIYEEGNLIKRSIRDLYNREIDEVLVEGPEGYRVAKDFMKMIMPSHAKNVQLHAEPMPLFARFQVESYLAAMFNPTVQLKSGGYIVIGVTEALVAIDVNSGRATKEGSIEETALKTNLEAAEEIARQLRLRDLAGLIVIDFIDMEERRNNAAVEKRLKDKLKTDRARIQVGRISGFGLLEMSRQRLRPGMLESTTQPCPHCHGTGLIRSDDSLALSILRALEEEGTRKRSREVLLKAPIGVINFLFNAKREHIATIEARYGMSVRLEADPTMISPNFAVEKFKTATRTVAPANPVVSLDAAAMADMAEDDADIVEADEDEDEDEAATAAEPRGGATPAQGAADKGDGGGKKRRRRRRRRRGGSGTGAQQGDAQGMEIVDLDDDGGAEDEGAEDEGATEAEAPAAPPAAPSAEPESGAREGRSGRSRGSRGRGRSGKGAEAPTAEAAETPTETSAETPAETPAEAPAAEAPEAEAAPRAARTRTRTRAPKAAASPAPAPVAAVTEAPAVPTPEAPAPEAAPEAAPEPAPEPAAKKPAARSRARAAAKPKAEAAAALETVSEVVADAPAPAPEPAVQAAPAPVAEAVPETAPETAPEPGPEKPRRKGWWSLGR
ncbi:MAG: Rne/Rng family ribonuclease [Gemmobacter sp.]